MTFAEFSARNLRRCLDPSGFNHPLEAWSLADWMLAAAGELGEAMNVAKKLNRERDGITGNDKSKGELFSDLSDELADAVIYLDLVAHSQGIDLSEKLEAAQSVWGEKSFVSSDISGDLLAVLVTFGTVAGIANQMEGSADTPSEKQLKEALGEYLGIATRRIFAVMSSRGYDPILSLDIKFRRTSAKIGYVEFEVYPEGAAVCGNADCASGGGALSGERVN